MNSASCIVNDDHNPSAIYAEAQNLWSLEVKVLVDTFGERIETIGL